MAVAQGQEIQEFARRQESVDVVVEGDVGDPRLGRMGNRSAQLLLGDLQDRLDLCDAGVARRGVQLGEARSGFAAAWIGPVTATVAGGVAAIAVTLIWARLFPELRRASTFDLPEPPPEKAPVTSGGV